MIHTCGSNNVCMQRFGSHLNMVWNNLCSYNKILVYNSFHQMKTEHQNKKQMRCMNNCVCYTGNALALFIHVIQNSVSFNGDESSCFL